MLGERNGGIVLVLLALALAAVSQGEAQQRIFAIPNDICYIMDLNAYDVVDEMTEEMKGLQRRLVEALHFHRSKQAAKGVVTLPSGTESSNQLFLTGVFKGFSTAFCMSQMRGADLANSQQKSTLHLSRIRLFKVFYITFLMIPSLAIR